MKKTIVLLAVLLSLVLLLGSAASNMKLQRPEGQSNPEPWRQDIKGYEIVHKPKLIDLQDEVRKKLGCSWQPVGGISFADNEYCQVMIK